MSAFGVILVDKCLIVVNRPVHIVYFYSLWSKELLPSCIKIDFFANQSYLGYLKNAGALFNLPIGEIYTFEEPLSPSYYSSMLSRIKNLPKDFFKYLQTMKLIKDIPLSDYRNILTFADDMLHFQYLIFLYKRLTNAGLVYLADEGMGLYNPIRRRSFIREIFKRVIFPHYRPILMGCNPLIDVVLARLPEKCNSSRSKRVEKIDYRITDQKDFDKWCEVFGVNATFLTDLRGRSDNTILFLGTPFEEFGISHDEVIEFLCAVRGFEVSDIIIKPHPKEDFSLYMQYFDVLPANLPAEVLLGALKFRFVLGYCSSALIEARLYGHECYYIDLSSNNAKANNLLLSTFEHLGIKKYQFERHIPKRRYSPFKGLTNKQGKGRRVQDG